MRSFTKEGARVACSTLARDLTLGEPNLAAPAATRAATEAVHNEIREVVHAASRAATDTATDAAAYEATNA